MPNGSLHDWLHSSENTSKLNLLQRTNIIKDVATALDYLHNHCQTKIDTFWNIITRVDDREKPTDDMFNEGLSIHKFASMALPDHVTDVIDDDAIMFQTYSECTSKYIRSIIMLVCASVTMRPWSSFDATDCKVTYLGDSKFSLEFKSKEDGCGLSGIDSGKNLEEDTIGDESDLVGGLTDSKCGEINVPIKMGVDCSITGKDFVAGNIPPNMGVRYAMLVIPLLFPSKVTKRRYQILNSTCE
nr:leucine-rich repeat protein [Tanacetum cinerariifolium]